MVPVAGIVAMADGRNDRTHLDDGALTGTRVHAAPQREEGLAERIGNLSHEVQPDRIPVVDPLQGHSRDVRPQDFLRKCVLRKRAHAVKIRHCCAIIHGCFATVTIQNIPFTAAA